MNILEPNCQTAKPRKSSEGRRSAEEIEPDEIPLSDIKSGNALWCRVIISALTVFQQFQDLNDLSRVFNFLSGL